MECWDLSPSHVAPKPGVWACQPRKKGQRARKTRSQRDQRENPDKGQFEEGSEPSRPAELPRAPAGVEGDTAVGGQAEAQRQVTHGWPGGDRESQPQGAQSKGHLPTRCNSFLGQTAPSHLCPTLPSSPRGCRADTCPTTRLPSSLCAGGDAPGGSAVVGPCVATQQSSLRCAEVL